MTYLENVLQLLQEGDFYVISNEIEIAKGKHRYPRTWREVFKRIKREFKWQLRKR